MDTLSDPGIRADLGHLLDKASQVLAARVGAALAELGITARGYCVLANAQPGTLTQSELAALALLDKTTMVVTVDQLEGAGLVRRTPSSSDRRVRIVQTTERGDWVVDMARTILDRVYAEILAPLPDAERDGLLDGLARLVGQGGPLDTAVVTPATPRRRSARAVHRS